MKRKFNRQLLKRVTTNITIHKKGTGKYNRTDEEILDEDLHVAIFKTAISPHWYVQYNHPAQGQQKKSLRTKNKKEAKRKRWEIVVKLRSGELETARRRSPTVEDVARSFLTDRERIGRKPGTIKQYRCSLEQFCKFCSDHGVARLDQLTPTHMMQYESQLRE